MNHNVLEMLQYLYQNGLVEIVELSEGSGESVRLHRETSQLPLTEIEASRIRLESNTKRSVRIFTDEERFAMSDECLGAIIFLDQIGIFDHEQREMVIEYLVSLEDEEADIEDLKWAVVMALVSEPLEDVLDSLPDKTLIYMPSDHWH